MTGLTCAAARRRLSSFLDGELSVPERRAVEAHLDTCPACSAEVADFSLLGELLRDGARRSNGPTDRQVERLQPGVMAQLRGERVGSLTARVRIMFEDRRLLWTAAAATSAAVMLALMTVGILRFSSVTRPDSLAAVLAALAEPGSNVNPIGVDGRMRLPSHVNGERALPGLDAMAAEERVFALQAIITREGQVSAAKILGDEVHSRQVSDWVLGNAGAMRFEPAIHDGAPVAVNMVWLLMQTTVRARLQS